MFKFAIFKNNCAYTLVEVMLAIVVVTIAIIPVLTYFANSIQFVFLSQNRSQALKLGSDIIELIKANIANDWDELDNFTDSTYLNDILDSNGLNHDYYNINVILNDFDFDNDGSPNDSDYGQKLTVEVKWGDSSISLDTLLVNR